MFVLNTRLNTLLNNSVLKCKQFISVLYFLVIYSKSLIALTRLAIGSLIYCTILVRTTAHCVWCWCKFHSHLVNHCTVVVALSFLHLWDDLAKFLAKQYSLVCRSSSWRGVISILPMFSVKNVLQFLSICDVALRCLLVFLLRFYFWSYFYPKKFDFFDVQ